MAKQPSLQQRVPDSRLPGAEVSSNFEEQSVVRQEQAVDEETDDTKGVSALALWPICVMATIGILLTITTFWYGPKAVLQGVLQYLVPERPTVWHAFAIWGAIVLCITFAIPVLLLLLPVPTFMFGFWKGFLITFMALMVAACLSFVIGRYIAFRPVRAFLASRGCRKAMRMLHVLEDEQDTMQLLILYRFLCIPMAARNYAPSVLHVPFHKLVLSAIPHSLWSATVFASAGSALKGPAQLLRDGHKIAWRTPQWQQILGLIVAFLSFLGFSWIAYRAYARRVEAEEKRALEPTAQSTLVVKDAEGGNAATYGTTMAATVQVSES